MSGLQGLTQRGTRHFLLNAHVAGRVLVLYRIAESLNNPCSLSRRAFILSLKCWRERPDSNPRPQHHSAINECSGVR
jgi:hypothetical protein